MNQVKLFLLIINQDHILKHLFTYLSLEDICNFSYTSKLIYKKVQSIKYFKNVDYTSPDDNSYAIDCHGKITQSQIEMFRKISNESFVLRKFRNSPIKIESVSGDFLARRMSEIGKEVHEFLQTNSWLQKLRFDFTFFISSHAHFIYFFSEIRNDKIKVLEIELGHRINPFFVDCRPPVELENTLLSGFTNLEQIIIYLDGINSNNLSKIFIDAVRNRNIAIETKLTGINYDEVFVLNLSNSGRKNILGYILENQIPLHIAKGPMMRFRLNINFNEIDRSNLSYIYTLWHDIRSEYQLLDLCNFLQDMINLKSLQVYFRSKIFDITGRRTFNENLISKNARSFNNLNYLKTLLFSFIDETNDEEYGNFLRKEILDFFKLCPSTVQNLILFGLHSIDDDTVILLSELFPKLKFLFLGKTNKIKRDSLKYFKNIKCLATYSTDLLELPETVSCCMVVDSFYFHQRNNRLYKKCLAYYNKSERFTKKYICNSSIKGTIFFNKFQDCYNIQHYFKEIFSASSI
uniref:F-box domain-containing protein n=1 Tax=Strongyloides papillosus TaxID=174720 RepID=A0A0N5CEZ8_STREA